MRDETKGENESYQPQKAVNNCLDPGPSLQNLLWSALVWNRLKPVALSGDIITQEFLQKRIRQADCDTFWFH